MKKTFTKFGLFVVSILIALLLGEAVFRLALNPANYPGLALAPDDTLGHKVPLNATGYDKWGFRNDFVPDKADIVAIGDSHTFGINASMGNGWPGQLQELSNKSVYNLSAAGGYGPVQYYHLFKTKALKLNPNQIVIGYYIGDDPFNAFNMVYNNEVWADLRGPEFLSMLDKVKEDTLRHYLTANIFSEPSDQLLTGLSSWLAGSSMLYRIAFHSNFVSGLKQKVQSALSENKMNIKLSKLSIPEKGINEQFRPVRRSFKVNISNKEIQEGLRLTFQVFEKIKAKCDELGIDLTILFIPTKEMAYCHYLYSNEEVRYSEAINRLLNNERIIREISIKYFMANNFNYIDALPLMQQAVDDTKIYPPSYESYPNSIGYNLMARSVYNYLNESQMASR